MKSLVPDTKADEEDVVRRGDDGPQEPDPFEDPFYDPFDDAVAKVRIFCFSNSTFFQFFIGWIEKTKRTE